MTNTLVRSSRFTYGLGLKSVGDVYVEPTYGEDKLDFVPDAESEHIAIEGKAILVNTLT
jgi:hypothetical protein